MHRKLKFMRTTIVGGVLFIGPLVVALFVIEKALLLAHKLVAPLAAMLPQDTLGLIVVADWLAFAALLLMCFLTGLMARTALARRIINKLEARLLSNIPGYEFFKSLGENMLGTDPDKHHPVLVSFDDCRQIGFLMDKLADDTCVVFLPGAPSPFSGGVFYFAAERVQLLDIPRQTAMKTVKRLGAGSSEWMKGGLPPA